MTKEQRTILKTFLKENAKQNRKSVAKNLIGFFIESSKKSIRHYFKNKLVENNLKKIEPTPNCVTHTPRPKFNITKKIEEDQKKLKLKIFHKKSTIEVGPSKFKDFKSKSNKRDKKKKMSNKELNIKMIDFDNNEDEEHSNIVELNKNINFTNLFKLHQNINELKENNDNNMTARSFTPNHFHENPIKIKYELENKKNMVFQQKSFKSFSN